MALAAKASDDGRELKIRFPERFDFSSHSMFRKAYESASAALYVLDMRDTAYMDSSALGMLLQLYEHAGAKRDAIRIINAESSVREILKIANFDKLMVIE